jgi:hypothetical protein
MSSLQLCRKAKRMPSIGNVETKKDERVTETQKRRAVSE